MLTDDLEYSVFPFWQMFSREAETSKISETMAAESNKFKLIWLINKIYIFEIHVLVLNLLTKHQ